MSCGCICQIAWSQMLSREWRCSWSSADRRCSNYIWVIDNSFAYLGVPYIRGFTVYYIQHEVNKTLMVAAKREHYIPCYSRQPWLMPISFLIFMQSSDQIHFTKTFQNPVTKISIMCVSWNMKWPWNFICEVAALHLVHVWNFVMIKTTRKIIPATFSFDFKIFILKCELWVKQVLSTYL